MSQGEQLGTVSSRGCRQLGAGLRACPNIGSHVTGAHRDQALRCTLSSLIFKSHKGPVKKSVFSPQLK